MNTQRDKYDRKKRIRRGLRVAAVVALAVVLFCLNRWLVNNNATVSDQAIVYLTAVLLFISFLQWDVTAVQNDEIERQLDQVEQSLALSRMQLQPLLLITNPKFTRPIGSQGPIGLLYVIENVSDNSAVYAATHKLLLPDSLAITLRDVEEYVTRSDEGIVSGKIIGGHQTLIHGPEDIGRVWDNYALEGIMKQYRVLFVLISAIYSNPFGAPHRYISLFRYLPQQGTLEFVEGKPIRGQDHH